MFDFETKLRHLRSLRPTRRGAAGKRSKRQRTTAFEFLEERCCPSTLDLWTGGGGTNLYSNAANWSLGVVPNNGNSYLGSPTTFTVEIPTSSAVTLDINATIDNLTIDAAIEFLEHCRRPVSRGCGVRAHDRDDRQRGNDQRRVQQTARQPLCREPRPMAAPSTSPAAAPSTSTTPTPISGAITATRP